MLARRAPARGLRAVTVADDVPRRPRAAARSRGDKDAYIDAVCDEMLPALAAEGLVDAVDAFCEDDRLLAGADAAACSTRPRGARAAGQAACRPVEQRRRRRRWRPRTARSRPTTSNIPTRRARRRWRRAGTVAVLLPGAYYFLRETQAPPVGAFRRHGVADGGRDRLQSGLLAADLAAARRQHGCDAVPPDGRGMPRRRHPRGRPRARPSRRDRHARDRQIGRSRHLGCRARRRNWSTAWASIRCTPGSGEGR